MTTPDPITVPGSPDEVRERLDKHLVSVRSVWFPTPKELRTWEQSATPLYVVWHGAHGLEVGPRLASMWASAFSPVLRGELVAAGGETQIVLHRAWPRLTLAVLVIWWLAVLGWAGVLVFGVTEGDESAAILVWWWILAAATTLGPGVGWWLGGAHLDAARAFLVRTASEAIVTGEDW